MHVGPPQGLEDRILATDRQRHPRLAPRWTAAYRCLGIRVQCGHFDADMRPMWSPSTGTARRDARAGFKIRYSEAGVTRGEASGPLVDGVLDVFFLFLLIRHDDEFRGSGTGGADRFGRDRRRGD